VAAPRCCGWARRGLPHPRTISIWTLQDENASISGAKSADRDYVNGLSPTDQVPGLVAARGNALWCEGHSKDYEFSRSSMEAHWRSGYHDTVRTFRHPHLFEPAANHEGVVVFDLEQDGRE
jgi:hypothetical protein